MSTEIFNYDSNGSLPNGGAPIYGDDLSKLDLRTSNSISALVQGVTDYANATFNLVGDQASVPDNFIVQGCDQTITPISGDDYELAITAGLAWINGILVEVDAATISYTYDEGSTISAPLLPKVVLELVENDETRVFENATTNIVKKIYTTQLSTDLNILASNTVVFELNDGRDTLNDFESLNNGKVPRFIDIINAYQKNRGRQVGTAGLASNPIIPWRWATSDNLYDTGTSNKVSIEGNTIHYNLRFILITASSHSASSGYRVWRPATAITPDTSYNQSADIDRGMRMYVSRLDDGTLLNNTVGYYDSNGWLCFEKIGGASFADDEVVYFSDSFIRRT